jgi:hypothetical protein
MTDDAMATQQPPTPSPDLKSLDRLVGSWKVTGGAPGQVTYEWMEGGFFLLQDVDLEQYGQRIKGIEIIGHERPFGAEPSQDIASRFYDSVGNTLDYVYELEGDTLTIWAGEKGSPAYYKGTFSDDGDTVAGDWVYPGGGGYESTMTRVRSQRVRPPPPASQHRPAERRRWALGRRVASRAGCRLAELGGGQGLAGRPRQRSALLPQRRLLTHVGVGAMPALPGSPS